MYYATDKQTLCSFHYISVIADAIIRHMPSGVVIEYIMACKIDYAPEKSLLTAVGACLVKANVAFLNDYCIDVDKAINSYVYIEPAALDLSYDAIDAIKEFNACCSCEEQEFKPCYVRDGVAACHATKALFKKLLAVLDKKNV